MLEFVSILATGVFHIIPNKLLWHAIDLVAHWTYKQTQAGKYFYLITIEFELFERMSHNCIMNEIIDMFLH